MLQRKEADSRVDQIQAEEDQRTAQDHQRQHRAFPRSPRHRSGPHRPDQQDDAVEKAEKHRRFDLLAQRLEDQGPRPHHDTVKTGVGEQLVKHVKGPAKALRQSGGRENRREAQRQLGQCVAADGLETVQEKNHAEKNIHGGQQMAQAAEKKGGPVGHRAAQVDGQKMQIQSHSVNLLQ